jgi:DNA recombination-dependent growth factor C
MLHDLKSMHMKAVHQRQMVKAGFLAACTAKAQKVMNDRITGIIALNFSAEEKAVYHSAVEQEALEQLLPAGHGWVKGRGKGNVRGGGGLNN